MSKAKREIVEQAKAFAQMHGDTLSMIARYALEFRKIITDFEEMHNREPLAAELLWIASEHAGHDIREDD